MLYKKLVDGTEKSMGAKNLLDHLKHCVLTEHVRKQFEFQDRGYLVDQVLLERWTALLNIQGKRLLMLQKTRSVKELLLSLLQHTYLIVC